MTLDKIKSAFLNNSTAFLVNAPLSQVEKLVLYVSEYQRCALSKDPASLRLIAVPELSGLLHIHRRGLRATQGYPNRRASGIQVWVDPTTVLGVEFD